MAPWSSTPPIVCYVTDRLALDVPVGTDRKAVLVERIMEAGAAGVDWIQVREKDLEAGSLLDLARAAAASAAAASPSAARGVGSSPSRLSRILINDRLDVACAARAGGVHLGEDSLPVRDVAENIGRWKRAAGREDFLVGASCHSIEGGRRAATGGADYIFFGPIFDTPSKMPFGPPQGLALLAEICRSVSIPVLAIGGITSENAASCLATGAAGIAAIRWFQAGFQAPVGAGSLRTQITNLRGDIGH